VSILVIDVGTSGMRAALVEPDASVGHVHHRSFPPDLPFAGLVEFDAQRMATAVLEQAGAALDAAGGKGVDAVGITNQRASTIVWERESGTPVGPALGWQDLRTVGECLTLAADGLRFAPNQSATKLAWLLNTYDAERARDLCFGTVDTWMAWVLSAGSLHVTDRTNAAVTGLLASDASDWDDKVLEALGIPRAMLPRLVESTGVVGEATVLPGAPPIAGLIGDQQASLVGQGCVRPGAAKITFGTGGMLDLCTGGAPPMSAARGEAGSFPIVAWTRDGAVTWGVEAIMLAAGSNVDWLVKDLGILGSAAESHDVASRCIDSEGVVYVPAPLGLGTPHWDYGARGTLLGLTRGSGRPQVVRAVLEGIAQRAADLVEAAEADSGATIKDVRVDGGMTANPTFVQAVADATGRRVEVAPVTEATTLGAGFMAGLGVGTWSGFDETAALWSPKAVVSPSRQLDRARWRDAVERARAWIPELSALDF
jgi:glycerol kinase